MITLENEKQWGILRKEMVSDLDQDDITCMRFLIAREFDITKAEEMIRENHRWRKEIKIDILCSWDLPEYLENDLHSEFTGRSKNGGPVLWLPMGRWLSKEWIAKGKSDEIRRYGYYLLENALSRINQYGHERLVIIFCAKFLTYSRVAHVESLRLTYAFFQTLERNYPEILQSLIVINAPWVFTIGYNFVKPILSPRTMGKVQVHGSDKSKWLPILREICPDDAIPSEYLS